jgi:hypothetical protein
MAKRNEKSQTLGTNVTGEVKDDILILRVDLSQTGEKSKSGKTMLVGTSNGFQKIADVSVSLNISRKE